jgi:bifunctional UDP-N-acetylglucosamine pyrophosphorylase/glucosamine-1-phosphate N-acetyltransferase
MDAVFLAAGLGTRLRPHTLNTPKPLLPIQGRPILDWALTSLPPEVDRVLVVVHYLAEQFDAYLKQQKHFGQWATVPQGDARGTGDALRCCRDLIRSDRFLVLNGDDLYGAADLANLIRHPMGLLGHTVDRPEQFGIVFPRADGTLEKMEEKPKNLSGQHLANTGAYLFPRDVFSIELTLSPRGEYEIVEYVSRLATQRPFHIVPAQFWLPIGTVDAWNHAQTLNLESVLTAQPKR